jgi:glycine/D-amino acid oxidase-like deaminating enzyme
VARLRRGTSLWLDRYDGPAIRTAPLTGRHEADVVIIGGGITGCVAAHRLATRGLSVVVLDAGKVGRGSTSASTALLMQEPDVDFDDRSDLLASLRRLYPGAGDLAPDYAWEGLFATTPDGLPYIGAHRRYPRQLFALGYGGNGMTFGFLAGGILERLMRGVPRPEDSLFRFNRGAR